MVNPAQSQPQPITRAGTGCFYSPGHPRATSWGHWVPPQPRATAISQPRCAMALLGLLLLVQVAFAGAAWDPSGGATAAASIPVPSLVVVASSGARSGGGTEMSLVGTRGGRAQCQAGPCGKVSGGHGGGTAPGTAGTLGRVEKRAGRVAPRGQSPDGSAQPGTGAAQSGGVRGWSVPERGVAEGSAVGHEEALSGVLCGTARCGNAWHQSGAA